jgi:hypothetical protein
LIIIAVVVIAAAAVAYAAHTKGNGNGEDEKGPEIPTLAANIDDVQVVVREVGTVEPEVKVEIKSNLSGRVVDLPIRAGDFVTKGQLIARIEPDVNLFLSRSTARRKPGTGRPSRLSTKPGPTSVWSKRRAFRLVTIRARWSTSSRQWTGSSSNDLWSWVKP